MKKRIPFFFCALLALFPLSAEAESLPEVLGAVSRGLSEGLEIGAKSLAVPDVDLTLTLDAGEARLEEGAALTLTLTAGNPYPQAVDVAFSLALPERLSCAQETAWQATLEGAKTDPASGELSASTTVFTREITLIPGSGESEQVTLLCEMSMGSRFYRAAVPVALCVPSISITAALDGGDNGRIRPGETFALALDVVNDGGAAKDVAISYLLPTGVSAAKTLPEGFSLSRREIRGSVRAEAASAQQISLPLIADEDALEGDSDASRLMSGVLTVDAERMTAPTMHVVGPMISARLTPENTSLEEGDMMDLAITVVNTGLAAADVELSCLLPQGLSVVSEAENAGEKAKLRREDGALVYAVHMDAAEQTESGIAAATKELLVRVRADIPLESTDDRLLGASLAWRTDNGDTQLSPAAALHVHGQGFLGIANSEWNGILLAGILMLITICCLYSACRSDKQEEEYCFD